MKERFNEKKLGKMEEKKRGRAHVYNARWVGAFMDRADSLSRIYGIPYDAEYGEYQFSFP